MTDLGTSGLNSVAFGVNESAIAVGAAELSERDPHREDFCGFNALGLPSSGAMCVPYFSQYGVMTPLRTLGGINGAANMINSRGQIAGMAENSYHVVVALNVDQTAVLDGFIVRAGRADGPGSGPVPTSTDQGSGLNIFVAHPRVENCTFEGLFYKGGTMRPMIESFCLAHVTKMRADELREQLKTYEQ